MSQDGLNGQVGMVVRHHVELGLVHVTVVAQLLKTQLHSTVLVSRKTIKFKINYHILQVNQWKSVVVKNYHVPAN